MYRETVWHSDSKERLGEVYIPRHKEHHLQSCFNDLLCVHVCRTDDDDHLSAEISNGSPVPPFCSECLEERFVLKLLQVQRGAQYEWIGGSGRQESLSGNHVPKSCPFLEAKLHGTSGMHVQAILIISCHITVIIRQVNQTDCTWRWTGRPRVFVYCLTHWGRAFKLFKCTFPGFNL